MFARINEDINAVMAGDPAARSRVQVLLLYSGLHAIWAHLLASRLHRAGWRFLARAVSQVARFFTGVEIHPAATIGRRFFIDHGMGVIIGETAVVGDDCLLYQGVTLGGTGKETGKRHPTLGNRVVVGSGAKVLGNISIGDDCRIGANSVVLVNVPSHSTVVGIPGRVVRRFGDAGDALAHQNLPDPIMESIAYLNARINWLEKQLKIQDPTQARPGIPACEDPVLAKLLGEEHQPPTQP
jgi:serine O-acetyltransferase